MASRPRVTKSFTGHHRFVPLSKGIAIPYCVKCGIIALRNKASMRVVNKPCKDQDKDED